VVPGKRKIVVDMGFAVDPVRGGPGSLKPPPSPDRPRNSAGRVTVGTGAASGEIEVITPGCLPGEARQGQARQTYATAAFGVALRPQRPLAGLDVGSGTGRLTPALAQAFGPVAGIEPSVRMRDIAADPDAPVPADRATLLTRTRG
jgi:hypothetical protein